MTEKKPESLTDNLASVRKYQENPIEQAQGKQIDFNKLKSKLEGFKKKLVKKFSFTKALGILPPNASQLFEEDEGLPKEVIETKPTHIIMIIPEEQYKNLTKIKSDVISLVKESRENLWVHIKSSEVDVWNYGLDSKFEFIDALSASFPLHDDGFLGALRMASIHKSLVLNWLNVGRVRYVATYAIFGSLVRGTADKTSDVDVTVIIDDTDVKRMSRIELIEKLRGRIVSEFAKEATALAGVKNILNVQVWLLTDFWQRVKDAEPVAFTFIRDGIPLFDKGTFIPWKRLLQMGKIRPSPEAIDLYVKEGDRTNDLVKRRLLDAMVDIYYGVITPTQAMMMLSGRAPPVPKVLVQEVKKALVDEEKVMSLSDLKTLEKLVKLFKAYEHGTLKEVPGKDIDSLLKDFESYSKKMKEVRSNLEKRMQEHQAEKINETTINLMKKILGNKSQEALISELDKELVKKGKIPERMLSIAREVTKVKTKAKGGKLSQSEMQRITRDSSELVDVLTEYAQRKELVSLEKGIAQITFDKGKAEVLSTEKAIFVVEQNGKISTIQGREIKESNKKELETALKESKRQLKFALPTEALEAIKKKFGSFTISF
jgi:predicted nucleotidyltransferase